VKIIPNEPVVAVLGVVVAVLTVLMVGVVNGVVVVVVAVEAGSVVPLVATAVFTVDSNAIVIVVGVNVLSAQDTCAHLSKWRWGVAVECRTCDESDSQAQRRKNSAQVSHTHMPLPPSSITWYRSKGGFLATGEYRHYGLCVGGK